MPTRAARPCVDCGALTNAARCPDHARSYDRATHHKGRQAVYHSRQWRTVRKRVLTRDPWCRVPGCSNLSHDVDHIRPLADGDDAYDEANLQGLCKRHHSAKTAAEVWGRK